MTALEQLHLYGGMQGLTDEQAEQEAARLLEAVGLGNKGNDLAKQMSGGQQRRLSLASSLIGGPAVCFCKYRNDPTTRLDDSRDVSESDDCL